MKKVIRLNYWGETKKNEPSISLSDTDPEVRLNVGTKSFISLKENEVSISAGTPTKINIQGFSNSIKYAGLLSDIPFPLNLIPSTLATPLPSQIINVPFEDLLPVIKNAFNMTKGLVR